VREGEPTRARYPDEEGYAERDGVRLFYEVYGEGQPTLLLVAPGPTVHSRAWKAQIPYLARHFRVIAFDPRGNGKSDRPAGVAALRVQEVAADALAVMDATATQRALIVSNASSARPALLLLAEHPERFAGAVFIAPYLPLTRWPPVEVMRRTYEDASTGRRALRTVLGTIAGLPHVVRMRSYWRFSRSVRFFEGVRIFNRHHWLRDQRSFLEWNFRVLDLPEAHSTKQIEDGIEWGMGADAQTLVDAWIALDIADGAILKDRGDILAHCARVRCPVLVIHGEHDIATPPEWGAILAEATGGRQLTIERCGHVPNARKPVAVNLALREFAQSCRGATREPERAADRL
jgi:pimeloyl-ACP methyl ester carboxylesterase